MSNFDVYLFSRAYYYDFAAFRHTEYVILNVTIKANLYSWENLQMPTLTWDGSLELIFGRDLELKLVWEID